MIWELIKPLAGAIISGKFLDKHGVGLHHIVFDCNGVPFAQREAEFKRRAFALAQGGSWMARNHFVFFETEDATSTRFETYEFSPDCEYLEPDAWFLAKQ